MSRKKFATVIGFRMLKVLVDVDRGQDAVGVARVTFGFTVDCVKFVGRRID